MTTDLRAPHLDTLAQLVAGLPVCVSFAHAYRLLEAGTVHPFETGDLVRELSLTDTGRALGLERRRIQDERIAASRSARRNRADVMRSLGMRRTRSGGWE